MKNIILFLFIAFTGLISAQVENSWLVNVEEAKTQAKEKDQFILVSFSGSDWCGNCMRLSKDLFETETFLSFADENLVLLNLDFPAKKANKLSKEQTDHNEALAEKYNKKGIFPLTLVLDNTGRVVGEMTYPCVSVEDYLKNLRVLTASK